MQTVEDLVAEKETQTDEQGLKPWEPQKLSSRHKQMIALRAIGWKNKEIAEALSMSESRVSVILNDPRSKSLEAKVVAEMTAQTTQDAAALIESAQREAVEKLAHLMRHADTDRVQLSAAESLLDRGQFAKKTSGQSGGGMNFNMDKESTHLLLETLRQAREPQHELVHVQDSSGVFRDQLPKNSAVK